MKCCLCGEVKGSFVSRTDLCTDCSRDIGKEREKKVKTVYKGVGFQQKPLLEAYPKGRYFVYRFLDKNKNLYIGKSQSLGYRLATHLATSPFSRFCTRIEYTELDSMVDMDIYETFLINRYQPQYNRQIAKGYCSFPIEEKNWESSPLLKETLIQVTFKKVKEGR